MRRLFSSRSAVVGVVMLVVVIGLITGSNWYAKRTNTPPFLQRVCNDVIGMGARIFAIPTNAVGRSANSLAGLSDTYSENQRLKQKLDAFAQDKVRLQTVEDENKALKDQLKLGETLTDYQTVSAVTIARTPTTWQSELIINKGSSSGLKKGMPVLAGAGVVGRVSEVNTTNAKVALISDTTPTANRFAVTIKGQSGTVNGMITDFDKDKNQIIMGEVTTNNPIKKGDLVQTSGLGGIMPAGLYVGKVTDVTSDGYGLSRKVTIEPAAAMTNIPTVTVAVTKLKGAS